VKVSLIDTPNKFEIKNILKRRRNITKYHSKLYRKLLDLTGCSKNNNELSDKFTRWCKLQYQLEPFDSLLYMYFIRCKVDVKDSYMKSIINWLDDNHYIYNYNIKELDFYDRFDTEEDAIKWIIAYRVTRHKFISNMRMCYEKTRCNII